MYVCEYYKHKSKELLVSLDPNICIYYKSIKSEIDKNILYGELKTTALRSYYSYTVSFHVSLIVEVEPPRPIITKLAVFSVGLNWTSI